MAYAPTIIDLSRVPAPKAIEELNFEILYDQFEAAFLAHWAERRAVDPTLPEFNALTLRSEPIAVAGEAYASTRLLDRARVNDALKALIGPLATKSDLDNLVASRNIIRRTGESDANLFTRYLLSYDLPSAGSASRLLFDAYEAWPQNDDRTDGIWDARVNGHAVHKRPGYLDLVVSGPFGRDPTEAEMALIRTAVTAKKNNPEAVAITVKRAQRVVYDVSLVLEVPPGPDPSILVEEAVAKVRAMGLERARIGGEIPAGLIAGAAYVPSVIKARDLSPVVIEPNPYAIPIMGDVTIVPEVRP